VIDATVCRVARRRTAGALLSFVGGADEIVARSASGARGLFSDVVHTGRIGSAQVAKAVNNLILWPAWSPTTKASRSPGLSEMDVEVLRRAGS